MFNNNKVQKHKTGITHVHKDSSFLTNDFFKNKRHKAEQEIVQESLDRLIDQEEKDSIQRAVIQRKADTTSYFRLVEKASVECKESLFTDIMFDIYMESLYLDDSFKEEYSDNIFNMVDSFVKDNGSFGMLVEAMKLDPSNPILNTIMRTIKETSKKVDEKNMKLNASGAGKHQAIDFRPEGDILEEYKDAKKSIDVETISEKVKEKVKEVIKDEQEISEEKAKTMEELEDKEEVAESARMEKELLKVKFGKIEENTDSFFVAIMKKTYKDALLESTISGKDVVVAEEPEESGGFENDDLEKYRDNAGLTEDELYKMETEDQEKIEHDIDYIDNSHEVDMDQVMAESIAIYTLYETFHTMNMIKLNNASVKKLIKSMM